ncbi:circumsporozoite (CS) protein (CSP) [Plasmodium ovale wallikeri]|uniref:Circumsporozoite protein n=1 Tax=Plasmodium ovale wallikeri TaxID=864142 RepID=A0A1A8YT40_PLAOA|nr:circumsporozoite (CS) protein (CSP) [Plasmodium ovale wallikeri]
MRNLAIFAVSAFLFADSGYPVYAHNGNSMEGRKLNELCYNNVDLYNTLFDGLDVESSTNQAFFLNSKKTLRLLNENPKENKKKRKDDKIPVENKLKQGDRENDPPAPVPQGDPPAPVPQGDPPAPVPQGDPPAPVPQGDPPAPQGDPPAPVPQGDPPAPAPQGDPPAPAPQGDGKPPAPAPQGDGNQPAPGKGKSENQKEKDEKNAANNPPSEDDIKKYIDKIRKDITENWSPCSVTCGLGVRVRRKAGASAKKANELTINDVETEICKIENCSSIFNVVSNSIGLVIFLFLVFFH